MNERLKQLEQMCWEELGEEEGYYPVFNTKKFAGLIVRECIDVIYNGDEPNYTIVKNIQKHFGVEE